MAEPLVSIIIPLYNSEPFIAATIQSALDQSWPHKEIIVVDDGSTDQGLTVAQGFEKFGVKILTQENRGGSAARNTGFWESKGEWIQFLDHDDLLDPDKISLQVAAAHRHGNSPVMGKWVRFRGDHTGTIGEWEPASTFDFDAEPIDWLISAPVVPTCAWLFPRELVLRAGLWNESLHDNPADDFEFQIRIASHAEMILSCPESESYFRTENPNHAGSNRSINALCSVFQTCNTYRRVVLARDRSPLAKRACADRYYHFMHMAYPRCPELVTEAGRMVASLGFPPGDVPGTPLFNSFSRVCGWKLARRAQILQNVLFKH